MQRTSDQVYVSTNLQLSSEIYAPQGEAFIDVSFSSDSDDDGALVSDTDHEIGSSSIAHDDDDGNFINECLICSLYDYTAFSFLFPKFFSAIPTAFRVLRFCSCSHSLVLRCHSHSRSCSHVTVTPTFPLTCGYELGNHCQYHSLAYLEGQMHKFHRVHTYSFFRDLLLHVDRHCTQFGAEVVFGLVCRNCCSSISPADKQTFM